MWEPQGQDTYGWRESKKTAHNGRHLSGQRTGESRAGSREGGASRQHKQQPGDDGEQAALWVSMNALRGE